MGTYVLVHGGAHGGWCYGPVARLLRTEGHEVYAPTMTGLGERVHLISPEVDLDLHITDIVNVLHYEDLRDVILVGHSYGGMVITGVADRALDRIEQLVYLDAAQPRNGESLADVSPAIINATWGEVRVVNGIELTLWPRSDHTYGVTNPDKVEWMLKRLTPHPWKAFDQPLVLANEEAVWKLPRTSINCVETLAHRPKDKQARYYYADNVWEIDTGHDLMITEPDAVAEMLLRLAQSSDP
jgi:pimeloyl-ACP methyl ester carboxylesterase